MLVVVVAIVVALIVVAVAVAVVVAAVVVVSINKCHRFRESRAFNCDSKEGSWDCCPRKIWYAGAASKSKRLGDSWAIN